MITEFLKKHGQSAENIQAEKVLDQFLSEMQAGLSGRQSSLAMVCTYLYEPETEDIVKNDKRIIIDAGGTNFRSAVGYFDNNSKAVFEDMQKTIMPASDKTLTKEQFYGEIALNIKRLLPEGKDIGFCFSYPVEMDSDKDGTMCAATKELKAVGISGTKVGCCTLEAVKKYDKTCRNIVILNDTVATLLGGMASVNKKYSAFIGYIYGTGTNIAYTENVKNITKLKNLNGSRRMLINTECGNFDKLVQGDFDKEVSQKTEHSDKYILEKMTSGKYLSQVINACILGAERENLFRNNVNHMPFELKDVTFFLNGQSSVLDTMFESEEDIQTAKQICIELIDRAAKIGAIANTAAALASGEPGGLPVAIVAEGTTFNKLPGYRGRFEKYLDEFLTPRSVKFEIVQGEDLNMLGSLMATMS